MMKFIILPIILFNILNAQQMNIYLAKQSWHTGIVISIADVDTSLWKEIKTFNQYNAVDVGWGDADFYQHPGFDAWLALKALLYPTPSALRVEAFQMEPAKYAALSERAVMIALTKQQFDSVCSFISKTYYQGKKGPEILSTQAGGSIVFYKAEGKYYALNTCNTWIADALRYSGIKIKGSVITAGELFDRVASISQPVKTE